MICLGLAINGVSTFGPPGDHATWARLGELLGGSDDPLLRQIGDKFLRSARNRSQDLATEAEIAFIRRCDLLNRYPDRQTVEPAPPPFRTESW